MKNINTILLAILLIAVIYLFVDKFSSNKPDLDPVVESIEEPKVEDKLNVAFINIDSINSNYQYILDQTEFLEKETSKVESRIDNKVKKAQKRYSQLEEEFQGMSQAQIEAAQSEIMKMDEDIKKYENNQSARLQTLQYDFQVKLQADLDSFLTPYKDKYDFIFSLGGGSGMLHGEKGYDISDTLIMTMNEYYESTLEKE